MTKETIKHKVLGLLKEGKKDEEIIQELDIRSRYLKKIKKSNVSE